MYILGTFESRPLTPVKRGLRLVGHAGLADRAFHVLPEVRLAQLHYGVAVPPLHERDPGEVGHHPLVARVEAARGELAVVGDVAFGERRPAGQRLAQRADAPLVPGDRPVAEL